jgi:glyoxylase-like metal-dependent hydrolase (beta-lactamase superfamily II)
MSPTVQPFFDPVTSTLTYVVYEAAGSACAIIDSVLDYDPTSGRTATASADRVIEFVRAHDLRVEWILETHAHADHVSAAPYLRKRLGGRIAIGERIRSVQGIFKKVFNLEPEFRLDGSQFDHLFQGDETFRIGRLTGKALYVPGHTPADMAYQIGDAVFVGDTLFMPDVGTARCDFPGGNAPMLYRSVRRILSLPGDTRLFVCHDYPPAGRDPQWETSVSKERAENIHIRDGVSEEQFVQMRTGRDATLSMPVLMLPAIQVNIRAGDMPPPEDNGVSYLKIPVNAL